MTIYRELRCAACSKLLAVGSGTVQIKCQRCKTVNQFSSLTNPEHPECRNCEHHAERHLCTAKPHYRSPDKNVTF